MHHWTPEQVDALPSDYVEHLIARQAAQADHYKDEQAKAEKKRKREAEVAEARRRMGRR